MTATTTKTYRAAHINECVLTGREHSHLSDEDIIEEAKAELERAGELTEENVEAITIGEWTD